MPYRLERDHAVAWLLSVWPILAGTTITVFDDRFTSRSWRFASGMPGGYSFWGGLLIVCGVLMVTSLIVADGRRRTGMYIGGLALTGLWWVGLGMLFLRAAIADPLANPLGVVVWTPLGGLYWVWAHYERRRL
jgi:hypothetical protein